MSNDKKLTMGNKTNQQDEKGHNANIVLAVSGLTAIDFLRDEVKKAKPFSPFGLNKLPYVLFDTVAQVMEDYKAACASSAVDKTVSVDECEHNPIENPLGYHCSKCHKFL